jgi:hypothetical protein
VEDSPCAAESDAVQNDSKKVRDRRMTDDPYRTILITVQKSSTAEIELWKNSIIYLQASSTINQSESEKF